MVGNFKRKKNFVDGNVQGALVRRVFLHWLYFLGVTAFAFVAIKGLLGSPELPIWDRIAASASDYLLLGLILLSLLPAFTLDTIRFSNRFVGPVVRLRRGMRELGEKGTTDLVKFREKDFWSDVAAEFNQCVSRMESQQKEIETLRAQVGTIVESSF